MKIWIIKAVVQKTISLLPFKNKINFLFQQYVTKGLRLTDELFADKLQHCYNHIHAFQKHSGKKNFTSLEIGTGWYPIVPIGLYLCGAGKIYSIDISELTNRKFLLATINKYIEYHQNGKLQHLLPGYLQERMQNLQTIAGSSLTAQEIYTNLNLTYTVQDARRTDFTDGYFDLINSNNTFEHIYPEILGPIVKEFHRILAADGIMSHDIDMSDHFAHLDKSITIYNFLRFSEREWKRIDNSIQPQSRQRITDYLNMLERAGFKVIGKHYRIGDASLLKDLPLDAAYQKYPQEELLVSHADLVMVKA